MIRYVLQAWVNQALGVPVDIETDGEAYTEGRASVHYLGSLEGSLGFHRFSVKIKAKNATEIIEKGEMLRAKTGNVNIKVGQLNMLSAKCTDGYGGYTVFEPGSNGEGHFYVTSLIKRDGEVF